MRSIVLHRDANRLLSSFAYASESSNSVLIRSCRGTSPCRAYAAVKVRGRTGPARAEPSEPDAGTADFSVVLPRKEVIQPHLPVRLPCYDFTPLAPRTFDASAPRGGFGRRLRVQTTRVV